MGRKKGGENSELGITVPKELHHKPLSWFKPYARNARTHSETQIEEIMQSMRVFGWTNPVIAKGDGTIIAGHGRLEAATRLEIPKGPVIIIDHLDDDQVRALVLADNKIALNAGWDEDMLIEELHAISQAAEDADWDATITGFDDIELEDMLAGLDDEIEEEEDEEGEGAEEEIVVDIPVTALGDVWLLGNHRVVCGDSTKKATLETLMEGKKAAMVFTDPPYNMDFDGGLHGDGTKSHNSKHAKILNDKMTDAEAEKFFDSVNNRIKENLNGPFYITFYRLGVAQYWNSLERCKMPVRSQIIWNKGNHTLSNSDYMSMYEPIFYGWVGDHKFYGGKNGRDIWEIKRTAINDLHPTMKPIELVEYALEDGSVVRDLVLDIFGGSGSTLIACENQRRHARVIELDPGYCDVIVRRWQNHTGKKAVLESTGKTFANMKSERIDGEKDNG